LHSVLQELKIKDGHSEITFSTIGQTLTLLLECFKIQQILNVSDESDRAS